VKNSFWSLRLMRRSFGHVKQCPNVEHSGFRFITKFLLRVILPIATEPEPQTFRASQKSEQIVDVFQSTTTFIIIIVKSSRQPKLCCCCDIQH
jgi:hypothetical protein